MTDATPSPTPADARGAMRAWLIVGLLLRVCVFFASGPANRDDHLAVVRWFAEHGWMPASNVLHQSYHPPLYYVLAWPIYSLAPAQTWPLHAFSLLLSCANLLLIRRLFDDPLVRALAPSAAVRLLAFALVATQPALVRWGSFVSNDPLTFLIGTLVFAGVLRLIRTPTVRSAALLGGLVALGLLTKGTFLLAGVALVPVVIAAVPRAIAVRATLAFVAIWAVLGSAKYVENTARVGRPFVHNLEGPPPPNTGVYTIWRGWRTVYDVDVTELIRHPVIRPNHPTSYALTLYATFWYAHLGDDSFRGNVSGYDWIGRATYAAATVPTLAGLIGAAIAVLWLRRAKGGDPASLVLAASLALLVANLAVVVAAGVRFDRWECFQGRLCLQSAMPMAAVLLVGLARLDRVRIARHVVGLACWAVVGLSLLYFISEFGLVAKVLPADETLIYESQRDWLNPA